MNTVVTQNDIKSIVDSIVSNTNATSKIIEASVKSITTIISKYDIKGSIKGLNNIVKIQIILKGDFIGGNFHCIGIEGS